MTINQRDHIIFEMASDSRYRQRKVYQDSGGSFYFSLPEPVDIPSHSEDRFFLVDFRSRNRMDRISFSFFKNSKLWWLVALANKLDNGLFLDVDTTLRIPAIHTIYGHGGVLSDD